MADYWSLVSLVIKFSLNIHLSFILVSSNTWSMWNVFSTPAKDTTETVNQSLKGIICVDICLDETIFAIGTWKNGIQLWSSQEKKAIKIFETDYSAWSIAFINDNQQLAILDNNKNCYMLDLQTAEKTSISLSDIPDNLDYNGIKYENNELVLITSDKEGKYTYKWAISSFKEPVQLGQEEYKSYNPYSQNVVKTRDDFEIKVDSEYRLLVSLTQNCQRCIQALEIPQNCFKQYKLYLACCSDLVLIWNWLGDIMIVDISDIKEQLKSM